MAGMGRRFCQPQPPTQEPGRGMALQINNSLASGGGDSIDLGGQDGNSFGNNPDRNRSNFDQSHKNQRHDQGQKLETGSAAVFVDTNDDRYKHLSRLLTHLVVSHPRNEKYTLQSLPPTKPPMDVELTVLVTLDKPQLYLLLIPTDYFETIYHDIQLYCAAHTEAYSPSMNEICLAKFLDGEFYRCRCVKGTFQEMSYLQLIDFGNFFAAPTSDIREFLEDFLEKPVYGLPSKLVGLSKEKESEIIPTLKVNSWHKVILKAVDNVGNFLVEYVAFVQPPPQ